MGTRFAALLGALVGALAIGACGEDAKRAASVPSPPLTGSIEIDGSATVSPLTTWIARRFTAVHPRVHVVIGRSGPKRGFARFCRGETDVADASEPIDAKAIDACERHRVAWSRVTVANDAVVLMVNRRNPIRCLTTDQLTQIWRGNSNVTDHWTQVGGVVPTYDEEFVAWGPGIDTETFSYFTWAVNRERGITRDYNNALHRNGHTLRAVGEIPGALGYADYRLYRRSAPDVRLLAVDSGDGCVAPSPRTIADGSYRPFAHRLFVYVATDALARRAVGAFLRAYLQRARTAARRVGFVALTPRQLAVSRANLERQIARASR